MVNLRGLDFTTSQVVAYGMATPPRLFQNGAFYHAYNRGNRKQQIFLEENDYKRFLSKVAEYKEKFNVNILAFCLMPNHFHFLLQQLTDHSISKFFSNLCNSQSKYFNTKYETVGSLFQGRFQAKVVDKDEYLIHLSRYIHLNPVSLLQPVSRSKFDQLLRYRWTSMHNYLSGTASDMVDPSLILGYFAKNSPTADYRDFLAANLDMSADPVIEDMTFKE